MCASRAHAFSPPRSLAFTLALSLGILSSTSGYAANLRKAFPELEERKSSLDSLALVADAIEIEDVFGNVENVLIHDSRGYAEQALQRFGAELAAAADTSHLFAPFFTDSLVLTDADALAGWRKLLAAAAARTPSSSCRRRSNSAPDSDAMRSRLSAS